MVMFYATLPKPGRSISKESLGAITVKTAFHVSVTAVKQPKRLASTIKGRSAERPYFFS